MVQAREEDVIPLLKDKNQIMTKTNPISIVSPLLPPMTIAPTEDGPPIMKGSAPPVGHIQKLCNGDATAWREAASEIIRTVNSCLSKEKDGERVFAEDIEEIAMDTVRYLHENVAKIKDLKHLRRSARKTARNGLCDHIRKIEAQKRGCGHITTTDFFHDLGADNPETSSEHKTPQASLHLHEDFWSCFRRIDPQQAAERQELQRCLESALGKVDGNSQKYIRYRYYDNLKDREIASEMNVSLPSVSSRIKRAVTKVGNAIDPKLKADLKQAYFSE
jgi:RNA polymerase sigma factor (sigma-70 family)